MFASAPTTPKPDEIPGAGNDPMAALNRRSVLVGAFGCLAALALPAGPAYPRAAPKWPQVDSALRPLVDAAELSGYVALAIHQGRVAHASAYGQRNLAAAQAMEIDTIFRIFSMTKPVTAAAMMILRDEGRWRPEDPIARHVPELSNLQVCRGVAGDGAPILTPPQWPPTLAQLMTHTAGFTYGAGNEFVDHAYRVRPPLDATSSEDFLQRVAALPLAYEPGAQWRYSIAVDIQGMIIERLSGQRLSHFLEERIFAPLEMRDTGFFLPASNLDRLAGIYAPENGMLAPYAIPLIGGQQSIDTPPAFESGGGGLVSTAHDYANFGAMLLGRGRWRHRRILSVSAVAEMMSNHISPTIARGGYGGYQRIRPGYEFGYNGVVVTNPSLAGVALGRGSYLWDGAAGTWFWVDPENEVVFIGLIQRPAWLQLPPVQSLSQHAVFTALGLTD